MKDTISRKNCIITVKNDDTICLARAIVTAHANLKPEGWSKTQLQDGFNKSRKLQKKQALKLHEEAQVEINDYGNDLSDINVMICTLYVCTTLLTSGTHLSLYICLRAAVYPFSSSSSSSSCTMHLAS